MAWPIRSHVATHQRSLLQNLFELQEERIQKILTAPFVCPVPDYIPSFSSKCLGLRKTVVRRPLHDPDMPNALILYAPPEANTITDKLLITNTDQ